MNKLVNTKTLPNSADSNDDKIRVVSPGIRPPGAHTTHIALRGVTQTFRPAKKGPPLVALSDLNLDITPGEFLCIVGPSGCGKSTLLNLIAGLGFPTSGEVQVDNQRVTGPGTDRVVIFQEHGLFPWLTVGQNVEFGLRMQGVGRRERRERADRYLRMVHLTTFRDSHIHQLSGGMKQRVAIARALATEPKILLMDEPFAALDAQTRDLLHDELERIWRETGCTIVFVTHNVRESVRLGDRVLLMSFRPGTIKQEFAVPMSRPRHIEETRVANLASEILEQLRGDINKAMEVEFANTQN
jgi:NitT/TauT family transport system ATP-binding protein